MQNEITDGLANYYEGLKKLQLATAAKLFVPRYRPYYFANETEFNDYISSPDYMTKDKAGVCMGV